MSHDHYFTAEPASADERRTLSVELAGAVRELEVAPGVFSPGRLDQGTTVLLRHAPLPTRPGSYLDLGCGWGPVALTLALQQPAADVWALDVNQRALDLVRRNAERLGVARLHAVTADEVPDDLHFDQIWSNPPIRVGKAVLHDLLRTWLPRLAPGGEAYLVVQKNLGADSLQGWITREIADVVVSRHASSKGFRVLRVAKATGN